MPSPKKTTKPGVNIKDLCNAIDRKDRGFFDRLTAEEQKKFSGYLGLRYASSVTGNADLQAYYLIAANKRANKMFFDIGSKHFGLQWLVLSTISPNVGMQFHAWVPIPSGKSKGTKSKTKVLQKLYPNEKLSNIDLMGELMTDEEFKQLLEDYDIKA